MARLASIVFAVFFLLISQITLVGAQTVSEADTIATQEVIRDQISAFQSQDHDRAFSHAAPRIKDIFKTTDRFMQMVKGGYKPLYDPDFYTFGRNTELHGEVYQEVLATDEAGKQWQAVYTLKQQPDGTWKITGVKMEPYKGAST